MKSFKGLKCVEPKNACIPLCPSFGSIANVSIVQSSKVSLKCTTRDSDITPINPRVVWDLPVCGLSVDRPGYLGTKKMTMSKKPNWGVLALMACTAFGIAGTTGCQVHVAGQTLPSPYYLDDDVQYFPAGSENKLANETAAMKAAREEAKSRR